MLYRPVGVGVEPSDRPYGIEAVMRDNSGGNWLVLVESGCSPRRTSAVDSAA